MINAAWRRYGAVNSLCAGRRRERLGGRTGRRGARRPPVAVERRLARAKDVLVGFVALTGVASAVQGMRLAREAPHGAVPLRDGDHTAPEATADQTSIKRSLNALGTASLAGELALVGRQRGAHAARAIAAAPLRRMVPGDRARVDPR